MAVGMNGFLGTDADFVIDLFLVLLVVLLPVLGVGIQLARRRRLKAHARFMVVTFLVFVVALVAFEVNVRIHAATLPDPALTPMVIHLAFAVPALALWTWQVATAKRAFTDPEPHRRRGRLLGMLLLLTVGTGIWLYVATFV